jgi:hypothetical protein
MSSVSRATINCIHQLGIIVDTVLIIFHELQTEFGKQVVRNYNKLARTLVEYEVNMKIRFNASSYFSLFAIVMFRLKCTYL